MKFMRIYMCMCVCVCPCVSPCVCVPVCALMVWWPALAVLSLPLLEGHVTCNRQ